jgi:hypothetical protein
MTGLSPAFVPALALHTAVCLWHDFQPLWGDGVSTIGADSLHALPGSHNGIFHSLQLPLKMPADCECALLLEPIRCCFSLAAIRHLIDNGHLQVFDLEYELLMLPFQAIQQRITLTIL